MYLVSCILPQEHQQEEFNAVQTFVEHHPLFSHMSPKYKRLLELSLRRESFAFDTPIITQGDRHKSLFFILRCLYCLHPPLCLSL